jgi:[glutamine synthetase] adenylyltransferase / [glutamine synthetase]-adenylyl-L-tyrosine phosphorylase
MRLRPSGNAGPLATSLAGFKAYHRDNAWTWEHLALSRARVVASTEGFAADVEDAVAEVMRRPRDRAKTIEDVVSMRALMARERRPRHPFDLKLADGGLVDLEFMAQSAQLVAGNALDVPQAKTADVLSKAGVLGLIADGKRLADIHEVFSAIVQVMSSALTTPFKEDVWSPAFKDLLAQLTHYPDFERLELDVAAMRAEVGAAASTWYEKARLL